MPNVYINYEIKLLVLMIEIKGFSIDCVSSKFFFL